MTNNLEHSKINAAVDLLIENNVDLSNALGKDGLIKQLSKRILERALQAEMDDHLGYSRYNRSEIQNARNGEFQKNLITDNGVIELNIPRDRNGNFEPAIVKKKQSRIAGLDQKIVSLYAKGMSLSDIKLQLQELYDADVSESLISKITDSVAEEVKAWQSRALETLYPITPIRDKEFKKERRYKDCRVIVLVIKVIFEQKTITSMKKDITELYSFIDDL
jgi:putative transposase